MTGPWIAAFVALWVVTLLTAVVVLGLLRRVNTVLDSAEKRLAAAMTPGVGGAAPGTTIGPFEAALDGATISSDELFPGVFVFMSPGCEPCKGLAGELGKIGDRVDDVPVYVVLEDTPDARELPLPANVRVLYQRERAVSAAFDTNATPQAFAVDRAATVIERAVPGNAEHVRELAARCEQPSGPEGDGSHLAV